ncbi:MAG TPA: Hpt domain-containing protein [Stellaceae bacterium]|jgi:HPt (histidine-containing phosphotransfer) domain-containing protein|nr:Hpt domain-containing protein [Stellaceae bacterium]
MTPPPLVDRAVIDDLVEQIGADAVRSVLALFIGEAGAYRAAIAEAAAQDFDAAGRERARRAAHSLKSGAGQIGAASLSAAAAAVEQATAEGAPELAQAAAALERCAAETLAALGPFLA